MKTVSLSLFAAVLFAGGASATNLSVNQGESADRAVVSFQTSDPNDASRKLELRNKVATRQCKRMGYSYTETEVVVTPTCIEQSEGGSCALWEVSSTYHCAGNFTADVDRQPASSVVSGVAPPRLP